MARENLSKRGRPACQRALPRAREAGACGPDFVEHPELVARRIEEAVSVVGDRERVIAGTDCGFGTFAGREYVAEEVVWVKLAAAAEGARIASHRLRGRAVA